MMVGLSLTLKGFPEFMEKYIRYDSIMVVFTLVGLFHTHQTRKLQTSYDGMTTLVTPIQKAAWPTLKKLQYMTVKQFMLTAIMVL